MMSCSTCGKSVDPLRAPAVRVSDGKIVPFCSKECASVWESKPVTMPAKVAAPIVAPESSKPVAQAKPRSRTPMGVKLPTAPPGKEGDDNAVIEIVHEPSSGVVSSSADARSGPVLPRLRSEADGAIQIADTGHLDDFVSYDEPLHKSRTLLWIALGVVVLAGAAAVLYSLGYVERWFGSTTEGAPATTTKVTLPEDAAARAPVATGVAAAPLTPELALDRARTLLKGQLKSDSPRVQRMAASALARSGDDDARALLATALKNEPSETAKVEIAYALARGGDTRGVEGLLAAAANKDRESRLSAGRRLASLGDKRAIPVLVGNIDYEQFRMGVAEALARFAEPRSVKVLEGVRGDDKATADEKARATIALGRAGRPDVVPELRELLADDRNNAFAAVVLADLHDEAARPVLLKQLAIPSIRVQAARALRRLDPAAKMNELLPPLLAALDSQKDTEQVQVAEAILLLAGPPDWSEHE